MVRAEAVGEIKLSPGFRAELVYSAPLDTQGSWVALTIDDRGRLIASDQTGALYRVTPSPLGTPPSQTKVEPIPMNIGMAQGLAFAKGKLYVVLNGQMGSFTSGLYRLSDSDNNDQFDRLEQLRAFNGSGEHGPHGVVLDPDGKWLYVTCGNNTKLPLADASLVPGTFADDQLLPPLFLPQAYSPDITAPGGWVARTDLDGNRLELVSVGFRNAYDLAFNADGELFTFDSDMEFDMGTPWYRPTRLCHVVSGGDYGWRGGNGIWPSYYPDTLPAVVDVGPGSPTGLCFGAGTKFPAPYQQALFAGDWSYGNIYAIHFSPAGASYRGSVERFASAMPLAVTDLVVRPQDGALYFAVGGRQSESAVYRVVWNGGSAGQAASPGSPAAATEALAAAARLRGVRRSLEELHRPADRQAIDQLWPHLASPDRFVRYAARVALEHQPWQHWYKRAFEEPDEETRLRTLIALAKSAGVDQQAAWGEALMKISLAGATPARQLTLLRAAALGVMRFESLPDATRRQFVATFNPQFPKGHRLVDRELSHLLVRLRAPKLIDRLLTQLDEAATLEESIDVALTLSAITDGWTIAQRTRLLDWFDGATKWSNARSFFAYLVAARDRFVAAFPPDQRTALDERISRPLAPSTTSTESTARPVVKDWKLDELVELIERDSGRRSFQAGRRMFAAAQCYDCHRIAGEGSAAGPDLTGVGGRFGVRDLIRSLVEPSHEISDQYRQMIYRSGGKSHVGRITNVAANFVSVNTDLLDPKKTVEIPRSDAKNARPSNVSAMPVGLLNTLSADEILDLIAFLRAGGDPAHEFFSPRAVGGDGVATPAASSPPRSQPVGGGISAPPASRP